MANSEVETVQNIEAAAEQGAKLADLRVQPTGDTPQPQQDGTIPDAQFRASVEKISTKYARAFEALARSERDDRLAQEAKEKL